jgi:hypothetical protein
MSFHNRRWVTIPLSSTGSIDFGDILETSINTLRLNVDGTETFVKYDGAQPASVAALSGVSSEYGHEEILNLLTGSAWTPSGSMPG